MKLPEPIATTFDPRSALTNLLRERARIRAPLRGDELDQRFAHFSDLAFCNHATHARRSGGFAYTPSDDDLLLFAFGLAFEDWAADALRDLAGTDLHHAQEVLYALPDGPGVTFGYVPMERWAHVRQELFDQGAAIGHPDFVLTGDAGIVIDTKTALFGFQDGERRVPTHARPTDLWQTASYAVALDEMAPLTGRPFPTFALWAADKATGSQSFVTYRTADFTALVRHGLHELMVSTHPNAPAPPPRPPLHTIKRLERGPRKGAETSWLCARCPNAACIARPLLAPG